MTSQERTAHNYRMLQLVNPKLRPKVAAVLRDLESHNDQPVIDGRVWRSPAQQLQLYRAGHSKVKYSYHNCTAKNGQPDALAADITDSRWGWDSTISFWLRLAASAQAHQMDSGIYWGLKAHQREVIRQAISKRNWNPGNISRGWDPAHIQVRGISLLAARYGKRP